MGKVQIRRVVAGCLAVAVVLGSAVPAFAATTIYVTGSKPTALGVGGARLTRAEAYNIAKLGRPRSRVNAAADYGYTVYRCGWGNLIARGKANAGHYPLEMFSKKKGAAWATFTFICYAPGYATAKGIAVGSSEPALQTAYGTSLKRKAGSVYVQYTLNSSCRWRTEFYCKGGRVTKIMVWTY